MPKRQVQQIGIMMIVTLTIRYRSDSKSDTEFEKSIEQCEQSKTTKHTWICSYVWFYLNHFMHNVVKWPNIL